MATITTTTASSGGDLMTTLDEILQRCAESKVTLRVQGDLLAYECPDNALSHSVIF